LDVDEIRYVDALACGSVMPDLTILLDIDPEAGLARTRTRAGQDEQDRFDTEKLSFHQAVRSGFLALAEAHPARIAVVDASADVEHVHQQILEVIRERLDIL
jgi:dTMP kinase